MCSSEKKDFKLWDNDYTVKDDDFSGLVLYHSLEGKFVNGWRYTDGEVTHKVKLDFDTDIRLKLKSGHYECTTYNIYEMFVECTYLGITGEYGLLSCSDDITYEYIGSVDECVYVVDGDDGDDDDSGAGGYSPDQGNNPYTPQSGDKFCKSGLSNTMEKQIVNTCVTAIMEYINNEFCGGNTNEGVYHADYFQTYGTFVHQHGVSSDNIIPFVSKHFNVTGFMGFTDAIDNGNIVMTDIPSQIDNSAHNVAVVGYHPDGTLIYMDPEQGCLQEAPSTDFRLDYIISISSCK